MKIGERLKALRLSQGLTLQEVGDALGVRRANLSSIETGRTNPSLDTISRICEFYGYKVAVVFVPPDKEVEYDVEIYERASQDRRFK